MGFSGASEKGFPAPWRDARPAGPSKFPGVGGGGNGATQLLALFFIGAQDGKRQWQITVWELVEIAIQTISVYQVLCIDHRHEDVQRSYDSSGFPQPQLNRT